MRTSDPNLPTRSPALVYSIVYDDFIAIATSNSSDGVQCVWRGDSRLPEEIALAGGFEVYPLSLEGYHMSLYKHTGISFGSGYISTSTSIDVAESFANDSLIYAIYKIAAAPNLVDVNESLGEYSYLDEELEYAAIIHIPYSQIIGWHRGDRISSVSVRHPFEHNPQYDAATYDNQWTAGCQYALAGFPFGHSACDKEQYASHNSCHPKMFF